MKAADRLTGRAPVNENITAELEAKLHQSAWFWLEVPSFNAKPKLGPKGFAGFDRLFGTSRTELVQPSGGDMGA